MKRLYFIILLTVLFQMPSEASTERLRIMTFNMSRTNIPSEGVNLWEYRVAAMQEYWIGLNLDLLCMQEPQKNDLIDFLSGMPGYAIVGRGRNSGVESGEYEPIIYNTKAIRVEDFGYFWLSETPDTPSKSWGTICIRMATWAILRDIRTGERFILINTHLDHGQDQCKEKQMDVVKTRMAKLKAKYPELPVILTGDMNSLPNSACYNLATYNSEPHMKDSWVIAETNVGTGKTNGSKRIDYIFVTDEISCEKCETDLSLQPSGLKYSDHDPCWADLAWETDAETDAKDAVADAQEMLYSLYINTPGTSPLITDADRQCSSDGVETKEGQYFHYITDGNTSTYLHSLYSTMPPNGAHWLQVDLKDNVVSDFHFAFTRRASATGLKDRWTDILITASNDKDKWTDIGTIHGFGGTEVKAYNSETVHMREPYRYVRFTVLHTEGMRLINGGPMFSMSEFQMYEDKCEMTKQYVDDAYATKALDTMREKMDEIKREMAQGIYDKDKASQLRAMVEDFRISIDKTRLRGRQESLAHESIMAVSETHTGTETPTESILNTGSESFPLSCNALSSQYNDMTTLLDGDRKTGIQSDETGTAETREHWIEAELQEPADRFSFATMRIYNNKLANCFPMEFDILASNDGETWDIIMPYVSTAKGTNYNMWNSPTIMLPKAYSRLRFTVTRNYSNKTNAVGAMYFNIAEFNVLKVDETGSEYMSDEDIRRASDKLYDLYSKAFETLKTRLLTYDEEKELEQAFRDLTDARDRLITSVETPSASEVSQTNGAWFTISGTMTDNPRSPGIYIKDGKKHLIR